jgi:hypothetical protein
MPDEVVTVSAAQVLRQVRDSLDKAQNDLNRILERIRSLAPSDGDELPSRDETWQNFIAERESELLELRGDVQSALGTVRMLQISPRLTNPRSRGDNGADLPQSEEDTSVAITGISATTAHRMSEIGESLKLTPQQTVERCVATQNYVDSKLREQWQFFIKRGRERRAVTFPGQSSV